MLDCLKNTIQLLELCDTRESGAYYINDIPYLSEEAFAYLRDREAQDVQKVFEAIETAALSGLRSDLFQRAQSKIKLVRKTRSSYSSMWGDTKTTIPTADRLKGWFVDMSLSRYREITLSAFELRSSSIQSAQKLYIFDLYSGNLIESIEFDLVEGHNTISLDRPRRYSSRQGLFIAYDANLIESWQESNFGYIDGARSSCPCGSGGGTYEIEISGDPEDMTIFKDSLSSISHGGLNIKFRIYCSYDLLFCDHKALLIEALRHKMALVYFQQSQAIGSRANPANMIEGDTLREIKDLLKDGYEKQLNSFFDNVKPDKECFECDAPVKVVRQYP